MYTMPDYFPFMGNNWLGNFSIFLSCSAQDYYEKTCAGVLEFFLKVNKDCLISYLVQWFILEGDTNHNYHCLVICKQTFLNEFRISKALLVINFS